MKEGIKRIVHRLPEGIKPAHESGPEFSRRDAEKAKSDEGQENLPNNFSNIFGRELD
jgi:hypothetical protein